MKFDNLINQYLEEEIGWKKHDGGRSKCGLSGGIVNDCAPRAIALASKLSYGKVYNDLWKMLVEVEHQRMGFDTGIDEIEVDIDQHGVEHPVLKKYLKRIGFRLVYNNSHGFKKEIYYKRKVRKAFNIEDAVNKYGCKDILFITRGVEQYSPDDPTDKYTYFHIVSTHIIDGKCVLLDAWDSRRSKVDSYLNKKGDYNNVIQVYLK